MTKEEIDRAFHFIYTEEQVREWLSDYTQGGPPKEELVKSITERLNRERAETEAKFREGAL